MMLESRAGVNGRSKGPRDFGFNLRWIAGERVTTTGLKPDATKTYR